MQRNIVDQASEDQANEDQASEDQASEPDMQVNLDGNYDDVDQASEDVWSNEAFSYEGHFDIFDRITGKKFTIL